jgi:hypothetical protein
MTSSAEMGSRNPKLENGSSESLPQENLVESQPGGEVLEVPNKYSQTAAFFDGFKRDIPKQLDYAQKQGDIGSVQKIEEAFTRVDLITKSLEVGDTNPAKEKIWEMLEQNEKILQREDLSGVDVAERINTMITLAGYLAELNGVELKSGKGVEKIETPETKEKELLQELPGWKKEIEKREGEPYEVISIRGLLEVVGQGIEKGYTSSVQNVRELIQRVEKARSQGVDLSTINDLDKRIEQMHENAPMSTIKSSLKQVESLEGKDRKRTLGSWYYYIEDILNSNKDSFEPEEVEKINKKLKKIRQELGLD